MVMSSTKRMMAKIPPRTKLRQRAKEGKRDTDEDEEEEEDDLELLSGSDEDGNAEEGDLDPTHDVEDAFLAGMEEHSEDMMMPKRHLIRTKEKNIHKILVLLQTN
ncbi:hypothetical protein Tco_1165448 [Tanacetum coccineum]